VEWVRTKSQCSEIWIGLFSRIKQIGLDWII
jgi:hypothetical protein